jgi:electron transfer flavoprotein beta subunit
VALTVAVLVKQVPDIEALVQVKSENELDIENRYAVSFFDEVAIEAALEIKKAHPDTELVALSAGGRRAVDALRRAIAMGIDRVEHLGDESLEQADSLAVAEALAARLTDIKPQLILCGKQALDDDQGAVGPMLAELLGLPLASGIVSLKVDDVSGGVSIDRKLEGEIISLQGKLPLVAAAEKGLAEPHVPVVTRVMKAMKAKIENIPVSADREPRIKRIRYREPATRPPVKMIEADFPENVSELVRLLQESGALS